MITLEDIKLYIENEKEYDSVKDNKNGILDYLNSLNDNDLREIADKVTSDNELNDIINSTIDFYLYHHREWFKGED